MNKKKKKKYKNKRMTLQEYLTKNNIILDDDFERQIIINGIKTEYTACRNGDIKSYYGKNGEPLILKPIILQRKDNNKLLPNYNPDKLYRGVNLSINGKEKLFLVHILIGNAFLENPENKPQYNHIDGKKCNNAASNLEPVTASENQIHAIATGLKIMKKGENHHNATITEKIVHKICNLILNSNYSLREIAKLTNTTHTIVTKINKGQRWRSVTEQYNLKFPLYSNRKTNRFND